MILNIILMVVFIKILMDLLTVKEGLDLQLPDLNIKECDYAVNIIFPYYDVKKNIFTDKNNYMYHNYQNIQMYASNPCESHQTRESINNISLV